MLRNVIIVLFLLDAVENNILKGLTPKIISGADNKQTAVAGTGAVASDGSGRSASSATYAVASTSGDQATAKTYTYAASKGKDKDNNAVSKGFGESKAVGDSNNSAATSKSASHAITKDKDGGSSASSSMATADAFKLGGKNGIGFATATTMSNTATKKGDNMTFSTGATTSTEFTVAGKKVKTPTLILPPLKFKVKKPFSKSEVLGKLKPNFKKN